MLTESEYYALVARVAALDSASREALGTSRAQTIERYLASAEATLKNGRELKPDGSPTKFIAYLAYMAQMLGVSLPEPPKDLLAELPDTAARVQADVERLGLRVKTWLSKPVSRRLRLGRPGVRQLPSLYLQCLAWEKYADQRHLNACASVASECDRLWQSLQHDISVIEQRFAQEQTAREELVDQLQNILDEWSARPSVADNVTYRPEVRYPTSLRLGVLDLPAEPYAGLDGGLPGTLNWPPQHPYILYGPPASRESRVEVLRQILVRGLAATKPGALRIRLLDTTSLGRTLAEFQVLADYDEDLLGRGVNTQSTLIEKRLDELQQGIETIHSKYLRGQHSTIHEYNSQAGDAAEPETIVVALDIPRNLDARVLEKLLSVMHAGPECGFYTFVLWDSVATLPHGMTREDFFGGANILGWEAGTPSFSLQLFDGTSPLPSAVVLDVWPRTEFDEQGAPVDMTAAVLKAAGEAARGSTAEIVQPLNLFTALARDPQKYGLDANWRPPVPDEASSYWRLRSDSGVVAPIGRVGAKDVAAMWFSSEEVAGGAVMVGLPRSGKTTSLHAAILSLCMMYSPHELVLYLIDGKEGVEFDQYRNLPHAKVISLNSEREFGLAVLRALGQELSSRARLFKEVGVSNLNQYRRSSQETLPRIVLIMDEFQDLFSEHDALGAESSAAFDDLARRGPAFGIHMLMATQTFAGISGLRHDVVRLLPERILFMCNQGDSEILLEQDNHGARFIRRQGDGLLNLAKGAAEANQFFRGAYFEPIHRGQIVGRLNARAHAEGMNGLARVYDGRRPAQWSSRSHLPLLPGQVILGQPFTLDEDLRIDLPRLRGGNLLAFTRPKGVALVAWRSLIQSLLLSHARVSLVEFGEVESANWVRESAAAVPPVRIWEASQLAEIVDLHIETVGKRRNGVRSDEHLLLVLDGLDRAVGLEAEADFVRGSDSDASVSSKLAELITSGPEVGVHVAAIGASRQAVEGRLGRSAIREFALRVASKGVGIDEVSLVALSGSRTPVIEESQILFADHNHFEMSKLRAFGSRLDVTT